MSMAIEAERVDSFTSIRPAWPHPLSSTTGSSRSRSTVIQKYPSPLSLAAASLYYSPSPDAPDNCTSFIDGTNISDWQPGDDALDRLRQLKPSHPWVLILDSRAACQELSSTHATGSTSSKQRRTAKSAKSRGDKTQDVEHGPQASSRLVWKDPRLLPTSKAMIAARKATFVNEWPHDGKRGWSCTSAKVAAAGFHYDPSAQEDDNATCAYCKKALAGWEKEDDPIDEHKRRCPECPFFNSMIVEEANAANEGEPAERIPKGRSRSVEKESAPVKSSKKTPARAVSARQVQKSKDNAEEEGSEHAKEIEEVDDEENQPVASPSEPKSFLAGVDLNQTVESYLRAQSMKAIQDYRESAQETINKFKERIAAKRQQIESMFLAEIAKKRKRDEAGAQGAATEHDDDSGAGDGDSPDARFCAEHGSSSSRTKKRA